MVKSLTAQRYVKSHKHKSDFYEKIAATQNWYVYILSKACIVYSHSVFRDGIGGRSEGREGLGSEGPVCCRRHLGGSGPV